IRAAESLTRRRAVTIKRGDRAFLVQLDQSPHISKAYPVYDWSTEDVWRAPSLLGWDYNRAYDVMEAAGITRNAARCSPPYGEQPYRGLAKFKTCWPDLWAKMTQRVHGAATAARYSTTELYGSRMGGDATLELPPEFKTWKAYAMAKMGVIGLTRGMASEGAPLGIHVNVVVPYAKTRPGTAFGPIPWSETLGEWLSPRLVAPLVVWLGHADCPLNGETISVGGGWAGAVHTELSDGYTNRDASVYDIASNVESMMSSSRTPLTATSSMAVRHLLKGFRQ
ncbi:MAG: DUF3440 domain-containing protein, partial [Actinobacteria bacterium]|nr:DUF3440 domain-containing protein [Actinomycetota bacterium]